MLIISNSGGLYPSSYPDEMCRGNLTKHDPPLLYDLNHDPGELNPLRTEESPYKEIVAEINKVSYICNVLEPCFL